LWCVVEIIRQLEVRRITSLTRFVLVFVVCGSKRDLVVVVCVVGLVFLCFVAPFSLLAVFYQASAFNSDVSKWITSAVTDMAWSKCTLSLSPSLWPPRRLPLCGVLLKIYTTSRGSSITRLSRFVLFLCVCGLKRDLVVVVCAVGLDFLFFVTPFSLLAVFQDASAFNQDLSNWNTGAVTDMYGSKCTLSLPLCGRGVFRCGVLLNGHKSHTLLFVWWGWSFFSLLHRSLFLQCFIPHLRSIRTCPNGIRGR
jgi:surface protein